jgi:ATP-dependent DNA helicase RecG
MLSEELIQLVETVIGQRYETQHTELKKALGGTPKRLYDTLSSFSNQTGGGIIIFGVDQDNAYEICGVYDPQDLQARVTEQASLISPGCPITMCLGSAVCMR